MIMAGLVLGNCYPGISKKNEKATELLKDLPFAIIGLRTGLSLDLQQMQDIGVLKLLLFGITPG